MTDPEDIDAALVKALEKAHEAKEAANAALLWVAKARDLVEGVHGAPCDCKKIHKGGAIVGRVPDPYCRMHRDSSAL